MSGKLCLQKIFMHTVFTRVETLKVNSDAKLHEIAGFCWKEGCTSLESMNLIGVVQYLTDATMLLIRYS